MENSKNSITLYTVKEEGIDVCDEMRWPDEDRASEDYIENEGITGKIDIDTTDFDQNALLALRAIEKIADEPIISIIIQKIVTAVLQQLKK